MTLSIALQSLAGGALIGLAATVMLAFNGRIAGISGIVSGLLTPKAGDVSWRAAFVAGLLAAGLALAPLLPGNFAATSPRSLVLVGIAGLFVGYGVRLGNGCTSGHGVCGLSRFSPRSLVATLTFMATGMATAFLARLLGA